MSMVSPAPAGPSRPEDSFAEVGGESVYDFHDPAFGTCVDLVARVERLGTGYRWAEGPVYFADLGVLLFSDIPNDRIMRYDESSGHVSVARTGSGNANGNTRDREGRLVTCEQGAGRVTRTEPDGTITVLADAFEGATATCLATGDAPVNSLEMFAPVNAGLRQRAEAASIEADYYSTILLSGDRNHPVHGR